MRGRGEIQCGLNSAEDERKVSFDLFGRHADEPDAEVFYGTLTERVLCLQNEMNRSVDFHGQRALRAVEVKNERSHRVLPAKLSALKASVAQCSP